MAIADRVEEAVRKFSEGDFENAMVQISIAIDATAKAVYGHKVGVGERYRRFIEERKEFIFFVTLGCGPRFRFTGEGGFVFGHRGTLGNLLYKHVRSALLHDGDVSAEVVFERGATFGLDDRNRFILSSEMIMGLILAVVGEAANASQQMRTAYTASVCGLDIALNDAWGRIADIQKRLNFTPT